MFSVKNQLIIIWLLEVRDMKSVKVVDVCSLHSRNKSVTEYKYSWKKCNASSKQIQATKHDSLTNPKPPLSKSRRPKTDLINLSASPLNFTFKHFLDFPRHFTLNQGLALDLGERVSILWEPEIFLLKKWKRLYNSNYCNIIMKYANIIYQFCFSVWVRFRNWGIWPFFNFFTFKDFI